MIRFLTYVSLTLLVLGVVCLPTGRAELIVGYGYGPDYRYVYKGGGLFSYGGNTYTRELVTTPGYYTYNYGYQTYYPGSSYYHYTLVSTPSYSPVVAPAYGPNWKSEAIKAGVSLADYELYYKTLNALGFRGQSYSFTAGSYYPAYASPALSSAGYNGNTSYGYGTASVVAQYGALDVNRTLAQAFKLGQGAQDYARESTGQLGTITGDITGGLQRVAETLAKGQAAAGVLKAAEAPPSSVSTTVNSGVSAGVATSTGPALTGNYGAAGGGDVKTFLTTVVMPACGGCHQGEQAKGKFDIIKEWPQMSEERKAEVYERLTTRDPEKRMPRGADGKPGALTKEQLKAFIAN